MTSLTGPNSRPARRSGFTLLELVLVMLIICTVLAAASPSLRGFLLSRQTDNAASRIAALARLARSSAAAQGRVHRLVFDTRDRAVYLLAQGDDGLQRPRTGLHRAWVLPDSVTVDVEVAGAGPGRRYIEFSPDGRAEPAIVRVRDIKGGRVDVRSYAPTEPFEVVNVEDVL